MMAVTLVTGNFFQVVRVNPVMGRALTPADDERSGGNPVIVLSRQGMGSPFQARSQRDRTDACSFDDAPFEIIGVTPEGFRGLEVSAPDFWAPLSQLSAFQPQFRGRENDVDLDIIGRLRPDISMETARAQLAAWDANRSPQPNDRRELEPSTWCRNAAPSRNRWKPSRSSRRCSSPSG